MSVWFDGYGTIGILISPVNRWVVHITACWLCVCPLIRGWFPLGMSYHVVGGRCPVKGIGIPPPFTSRLIHSSGADIPKRGYFIIAVLVAYIESDYSALSLVVYKRIGRICPTDSTTVKSVVLDDIPVRALFDVKVFRTYPRPNGAISNSVAIAKRPVHAGCRWNALAALITPDVERFAVSCGSPAGGTNGRAFNGNEGAVVPDMDSLLINI